MECAVTAYRILSPMGPRIAVKGASGSGKTSLATELARRLGVPHIELDALHHGPNWSEATADEFRARVRAAMDSNPDGWVIDGNYERKLDRLVTDAADTVVWLDLPLPILLVRLWRRTSHRIRTNEESWNGNRESWRTAIRGREVPGVQAVPRRADVRRGARVGAVSGDHARRGACGCTVGLEP
jgi:adenylate kinase family enzyme